MAETQQPHDRALPNYANALITRDKLERYCLDSNHLSKAFGKSSGKDKARVFKAALGFVKADWKLLANRILEALPYAEAIVAHEDDYGKRYTVAVAIAGPNGSTGMVLTAWIIRPGTDFPSLTTAYVMS